MRISKLQKIRLTRTTSERVTGLIEGWRHRVIEAALILTAGCAAQAWAAPIISPFAADLPSSSYSASGQIIHPTLGRAWAEDAFNGGYWNAGGLGPQWIQADMGSTKTLSKVIVNYAGSAPLPIGGANVFIKAFLSDNPIGNLWTSLAPVATAPTPFTTNLIELVFAPTAGRYLQIVANYGGYSWVALGNKQGRQDWEDPVSSGSDDTPVSAVPTPGTLALLLAGLGVLGLMRKRA